MTPNASSLPARKRATSCSSERNRKRRTGCQPGRRSAAGALRAEASTNVLFSRTLTTRGGGSCASVLSNLHRTRTSRGHRRPNVAPGMRRIAVVEDSETLAEAVAARLRAEGYEARLATDGPSGVELCREWLPDLVVLDLMLPGFDGLEVCRRAQADRPVPVVMLTARDTETDLLVGLGVGADDYMVKPFSMRELVARVAAILRRTERAAGAAAAPLRVAGLELDPDVRRA